LMAAILEIPRWPPLQIFLFQLLYIPCTPKHRFRHRDHIFMPQRGYFIALFLTPYTDWRPF
jgi:hypothetical protein